MAIEDQLIRVLENLTRQTERSSHLMEDLARMQGFRGAGRVRPGEAGNSNIDRQLTQQEKKIEGYDSAHRKFYRLHGKLMENLAKGNESLEGLNKVWDQQRQAAGDLGEEYQMYGQGIGKLTQQANRIVKGMSRYESALAKTTKAQSLLYAEQLRNVNSFKDFEFAAYLEKMTESMKSLDLNTKKALNLVDEATGELRTDLGLKDFERVRLAIGDFASTIDNQLSKAGYDSLDQIIKLGNQAFMGTGGTGELEGGRKNKELLMQLVAEATTKGLRGPVDKIAEHLKVTNADGTFKSAKDLEQVDWAALAKELNRLTNGVKKTSDTLDKTIRDFTVPFKRFYDSLRSAEGRVALFGAAMDKLLSAAFLTKMVQHLKQVYQDFSDFNIAQVPQSFIQTQFDAIKLGMAFQDTVKLMQENKRMLAIYGPGEFKTAFGGMQDSFKKFGYTMKQSAELIGPTVESAIMGGVNVRDSQSLATYTEKLMTSFQEISGIVDITAKDFIQMNNQLFQAEGTFDTLMGMDKSRRAAFQDELIQLRNKHVVDGLSIQQAQKLVELQQQQQRDSVKTRIGAGAKLMQAAMFGGMDSQSAMRLMVLRNKGIRTAAEDLELKNLTGRASQGLEARRQREGAMTGGFTWTTDMFTDNNPLEQSDKEVAKLANQSRLMTEAMAVTTKAEQARASAAAKGNETFASFSNAVNMVSAILQNSLAMAAITATGALIAFAVQAGWAAKVLAGLPGGKGLAAAINSATGTPGVPTTGGTVAGGGKWGSAAKWGGRALGGIGTALAGYQAYQAYDSFKAGGISESDRNAAFGEAGGALAGGLLGAKLGAMAGAFGGPPGILVGSLLGSIGGAVGGSLGGNWFGSKFGSKGAPMMNIAPPTQKPATIVATEGINTPAQDGKSLSEKLSVTDEAVGKQLASLQDTMKEAVEILKQMHLASGGKVNEEPQTYSKRLPPVPTHKQFLVG